MLDDRDVREGVRRVERQLAELEQRAGPALYETIEAALAGLLDLYGEGLARMQERAVRAGGDAVQRALASDEWVSQLLLLHGLHPDPPELRVEKALAALRPHLQTHGGDVEWVALEGGTLRLRLRGACEGCPASAQTLRDLVDAAVREAAPEVERIEAVDTDGTARSGLLSIEPPELPAAAAQGGSR